MSKAKRWVCIYLTAAFCVFGAFGLVGAQSGPTPITAEQAFDAWATQTDPLTGATGKVALVDVRSKAEYYWVGAAAKVDKIILWKGEEIVPDFGKTQLVSGGKLLKYSVAGNRKTLNVKFIKSIKTSPISFLIPYKTWNEEEWGLNKQPEDSFKEKVEALAGEGFTVIILFCRSGGRTDGCFPGDELQRFNAVYEIDQPDGATNHGGIEGSSYGEVYNGYRGFPERETSLQEHESVSWKDAGLPIKIGLDTDISTSTP